MHRYYDGDSIVILSLLACSAADGRQLLEKGSKGFKVYGIICNYIIVELVYCL